MARTNQVTSMVHDELWKAIEEGRGHESRSNYVYRILAEKHGMEVE